MIVNEFEQQEKASTLKVIKLKINEYKKSLYTGGANTEPSNINNYDELLARVEDLESSQLKLESTMSALTPSDDLEAVKARLNQIIGLINN